MAIQANQLMEDIEVSKQLKRVKRLEFYAPRQKLVVSSRRWRRRGVARTILSMWAFRLRYWCGVSAETLYNDYYVSSLAVSELSPVCGVKE